MLPLVLEAGNPAHGGYCVSRISDDDPSGLGGKVALVTGTLPGERVEAEVLEDHPRHLIARTTRVLTPSPDRVEHVWPLAAATGVGGADLGHVAPAAQVRWKEAVIRDVMRRIGGPEVAEAVGEVPVRTLPGGVVGWRTRVGFVVDQEGRPAMRRGNSHELVAVDSMPLAVAELDELDLFGGGWDLEPGTQVRAVAPSDSRPVLVTPGAVFSAPGRSAGARVRELVTTDSGTYRYAVHAAGFWQSHRAAPSVLVRAVLDAARLAGGERVLELYSGAGLFTVPLAEAVGQRGRVSALEGARAAVEDARANLSRHP
ncbi:MAG: class I SAM-dependent RNA methyltransferase, partial [bacterium]|nr:class I SAM-dependent RNA methyltransferase [bacterium]